MYLKTFAEYKEAIDLTRNEVALTEIKNGGKPLVIDFTAKWSAPCKKIRAVYEAQIEEYPELVFKKLDVDAVPEGSRADEIQNMPTFKIYMNGEVFSKLDLTSDKAVRKLLDGESYSKSEERNAKALKKLLDKAKEAWLERET